MRVIEHFFKTPIYTITVVSMSGFIVTTGYVISELSKYTYHFKTPVLIWGIVSITLLVLSVILFIISFQKFINDKDYQLTEIKNDKNNEIDELKNKIRLLNEKNTELIQEHQKNLQGQVQTKERIVKQRDDYAKRNAVLEVQNKYHQLFVERIMQTFPEKDISQAVKSIDLDQITIESEINEQ
ncbi:hypothetical protein KII97_01915 [Leuconostoc gelidum subsp. gasicomitatum]|uniref:hypothetical protein n=1 Tax=Leuconostoc gasicomitatum TaxID=115778 RepID=UPI001CC3F699|nr:hypothetical protein [Leuconostoc gasicomitatum]MBZ5995263.1 hypothetical protein [Leuconostoc gasicomitatum]